MDYVSFQKELQDMILNNPDWDIQKEKYRFYPDGFVASDKGDSEFIHSTNIKYHKVESSKLIGDYISFEKNGNLCRFNVKYLYDEYSSLGWEQVKKIIDENIKFAYSLGLNEFENHIDDYSYMKDKLIIRPINFTNNKYELKNVIYRQYGDIALVLYFIVQDDKINGLTTVKVTKQMFSAWNQDLDEVFDYAMANTNIGALPRLYLNPQDCVDPPYERGAFMALDSPMSSLGRMQIPIITTTRQINGAIAMFYPGVKEKLAELFGADYYVAFTSTSEARIHHKDSISPRSVLNNLKGVNKSFPEDDLLSRKVFYFNRETGEFTVLEL